jgi:hypothetical protein
VLAAQMIIGASLRIGQDLGDLVQPEVQFPVEQDLP